MADRLIRAQVSIPMATGLPKDTVVNTFHFDDDDDPIAAWSDSIDWAHSMLTTFYQAIDDAVFPNTVGTTATVRYYDMREAEPRVPKDTRTITLTPSSDDPLPHEVAICLSFKAVTSSGENPRRRRGRVYLGPVKKTACNFQGRVGSLTYTAIANAAAAMEGGFSHPASPGLDMKWAIYSPTTDATSSIDDAFHDVADGWVDDAFDIQRRRGVAASTRTTWT
jgi:hypothetical protein